LIEDKKYLEAGDACMGYLLGANPNGYCFVAGYGYITPVNIHERRSVADGIAEPIPGYLVGGPTRQAQLDCGKDKYPSDLTATSCLDAECSYSTNEMYINWNASFVFLIGSLDEALNL
jgi:endoglucanase